MKKIWWTLGAVGAAAEAVALATNRKGDTLSEQIWSIRKHPVGKHVVVLVVAWTAWHFLFDSPSVTDS